MFALGETPVETKEFRQFAPWMYRVVPGGLEIPGDNRSVEWVPLEFNSNPNVQTHASGAASRGFGVHRHDVFLAYRNDAVDRD
jgi:hypothetical protein